MLDFSTLKSMVFDLHHPENEEEIDAWLQAVARRQSQSSVYKKGVDLDTKWAEILRGQDDPTPTVNVDLWRSVIAAASPRAQKKKAERDEEATRLQTEREAKQVYRVWKKVEIYDVWDSGGGEGP